MKPSYKIGVSFGITSGIITTLGLMVGLSAGTHSQMVVIGGILTIAIADAFSDALGIHISEESSKKVSESSIWEATIATFIAKFLFALTFVIPVLLLPLTQAIIVSITWGLLALSILSFLIARAKKESPWKPIGEHLVTAILVIITTHYLGAWIATKFS